MNFGDEIILVCFTVEKEDEVNPLGFLGSGYLKEHRLKKSA